MYMHARTHMCVSMYKCITFSAHTQMRACKIYMHPLLPPFSYNDIMLHLLVIYRHGDGAALIPGAVWFRHESIYVSDLE
jgi:hypothetical protein